MIAKFGLGEGLLAHFYHVIFPYFWAFYPRYIENDIRIVRQIKTDKKLVCSLILGCQINM